MKRIAVVRGALGANELVRPQALVWMVGAAPLDRAARRVARVLGARQLLQAVVTAARPRRSTATLGAAVDAAHALSMVVLAVRSARYRRVAYAEAVLATGLALAGCVARRRLQSPPAP